MNITSAKFITSAVKPSQYPPADVPEVAFAGRSNVGKSSLINVLVNRRNLVKTGRTPGRTQLVNFFLVNDRISFVDLPGYGYAKVPAAVRKKWGPMIETYLSSRESLRCVVLIMDIRRTPGVEELNFIDWLAQEGLVCLPVLTKTDKLSKTRQIKQQNMIGRAIHKEVAELTLFSSKTRKGRDRLLRAIDELTYA